MESVQSSVKLRNGNVHRLFEAADEGPFLHAELVSAAGRGKLRVTYDWLYSALNCTPDDDSPFFWEFRKLSDGRIALSPESTPSHVPDQLFASVRDDWDWRVQTQAPHSADWITAVARDERLRIHGTYVVSVVFEGFNDKYVVVNADADHHDGHTGYRLRSVADEPVESCVFRVRNATVLQDHLQFLERYTVEESDVRAVADGYGLQMSDESVRKLTEAFPEITPELLRSRADAEGRAEAVEGSTTAIGATVGGIVGGGVGFAMAGPAGAVAGFFAGIGAGGNIGKGLELTDPRKDPENVVDPSIPDVDRTLTDISPAGGPYDNKHLWKDVWSFTQFNQIGYGGRPDAGCLLPPATDGTAQVWYPQPRVVDKPVADPDRYQPMPDVGFASIFVVVKLKNGRYQLRLHPDEALINLPDRPTHSQLTQGSRLLALLGGKFVPLHEEQQMQVYAAGELYYLKDGTLVAVTPKTGHYFPRRAGFNEEVFETTKRHLDALGYDTGDIRFEPPSK